MKKLLVLLFSTIPLFGISQVSNDTINGMKYNLHLPNVEVLGNHSNFGVEASQMSALSVSPQMITRVPMFLGEADVLKALQRLPGVQTGGEGTAGIMVRGGDYDQNLITIDGAPLYNAEHLKGYTSAINPDVLNFVDFYRGAFPARYGSRLSSVVDVRLRDGDNRHYHGSATIGMLSSSLQVEGPIWRGHTSFNIARRMSYFNLIAKPILEHFYDRPDAMQPYANVKYYDITARLTHRFNDSHSLAATFYYGKDYDDNSPSRSNTVSSSEFPFVVRDEQGAHVETVPQTNKSARSSATDNNWSNLIASMNYNWTINERLKLKSSAYFSKHRYKLGLHDEISKLSTIQSDFVVFERQEETKSLYNSSIDDLGLNVVLIFTAKKAHDARFGFSINRQDLKPSTSLYHKTYTRSWNDDVKYVEGGFYSDYNNLIDTTFNAGNAVNSLALFVEDDWEAFSWLKFNVGLRFAAYGVSGKTYASLEPRLSARFKLMEALAFKISYSRMSQAIHRLKSNNLTSANDIWVPSTSNIPLTTSDLFAAGFNYDISHGIHLGVEGYYKTLDNVVEYRQETTSTTIIGDWQQQVALGKGRSYGFEFIAEKKLGRTTGWISYTWSKSLRTFDRQGMRINGGKEYYAVNDRRHNLNAVITHNIPLSEKSSLELTASWNYTSGRCGTLPSMDLIVGMIQDYDPFAAPARTVDNTYIHLLLPGRLYSSITIDRLLHVITYKGVNDYRLPATHHLDLGATWSIKHGKSESAVTLSIYNVYNHMNVGNVYVGFSNDTETTLDGQKITKGRDVVLKGICPFPFMPSISYRFKF